MSIYPYRKEALEALARKSYPNTIPAFCMRPPDSRGIDHRAGMRTDDGFQFIRSNGRVLGETVFETAMVPIYERDRGGYKLIPVKAGTVIIDASLIHNRGDGRFRFTCAHELAHWVLHKEFYTQRGETAAMTNAARSSETDLAIERQADRLGCYLLMPKGAVKMAFYNTNGSAGNKTTALAELFGVSRQAMQIRLEEMRLLP